MSRGKYLSLEDAKDEKRLKRFMREHPSKGNKRAFDKLLGRMAKNKSTKNK